MWSLFPFAIRVVFTEVIYPPILFFRGKLYIGGLAKDTKEKEMWEDSSWPDHGGWDARNTIIHTKKRGRNEPRGEVRILKG